MFIAFADHAFCANVLNNAQEMRSSSGIWTIIGITHQNQLNLEKEKSTIVSLFFYIVWALCKSDDKYDFRSKGDLLAAGDILCKVQDSKSQVSANEQMEKISPGSINEQREKISQGSANEQNGNNSQGSADEQSLKIGTEIGICENSAGMHIKMSRSKKATASIGTVSSILGNSYRPSSYVKEKFEKAKPIKIEVEKSVLDVPDVGSSSSGFQGSKKESLSNREIEQFLFSMLGDGFKLSMDVIREVLGIIFTCTFSSILLKSTTWCHCRC